MTQIQNGSGNPNATPLTPRDEEKARIEERRRFVEKLDADFQFMQAEIQLQRSLGPLRNGRCRRLIHSDLSEFSQPRTLHRFGARFSPFYRCHGWYTKG